MKHRMAGKNYVFRRFYNEAQRRYGWLATKLVFKKIDSEFSLTTCEDQFLADYKLLSVLCAGQGFKSKYDKAWSRNVARNVFKNLQKLYENVMDEWVQGF